jgi:hypothetical protein
MVHKFHVGQTVFFRKRNAAGGLFEVIKQLPEERPEPEYRVKSLNEPHERVARESELREP